VARWLVLPAQRRRPAALLLQAGADVSEGELDVRRHRGRLAEAAAAPRRAKEAPSAWADRRHGCCLVPSPEGPATDATSIADGPDGAGCLIEGELDVA
jgi:hypothetical protein